MCTFCLCLCCVNCVQVDSGGKAQRKQRPFDFTKFNTRHVALKIAYLGWDYQVYRLTPQHIQGPPQPIIMSELVNSKFAWRSADLLCRVIFDELMSD